MASAGELRADDSIPSKYFRLVIGFLFQAKGIY